MKKQIIFFFIISSIMSACGKLPINGNLDGMWQLMQIEDKLGEVKEMKEQQIYYNIQLKLIHIRKVEDLGYVGRFNHTGDSLTLYDFRSYYFNNTILAQPEDLRPYGLNDTVERFEVKTLTKSKMIIESQENILYFRKY